MESQTLLKASKIRYSNTKKLLCEQDPKLSMQEHLLMIKVYHKSTETGEVTATITALPTSKRRKRPAPSPSFPQGRR